jgi:hypothetical protein
MSLTPIQLAAAVEEALTTLEAAGVPRDLVVLGLSNPHVKGSDTLYDTHVSATRDWDTACLIALVARDIESEAARASRALADSNSNDACPSCGSPRWAHHQARRDSRRGERPGVYIRCWQECMDCGHKGPER